MNRPAEKAAKPVRPSRDGIVVTSANSPDVDLAVQALLPLLRQRSQQVLDSTGDAERDGVGQ
jgi:hypothetical protein